MCSLHSLDSLESLYFCRESDNYVLSDVFACVCGCVLLAGTYPGNVCDVHPSIQVW